MCLTILQSWRLKSLKRSLSTISKSQCAKILAVFWDFGVLRVFRRTWFPWFSGVLKGYKMGTLTRDGLITYQVAISKTAVRKISENYSEKFVIKVFKNRPFKIYERQLYDIFNLTISIQKNFHRLSSTNFIWSMLESFVLHINGSYQ